ncbi:MAG TPA: 50S ribosomal protein L5 [Ktedonobacterales bacterium]|nr:50S ribosomal protein L5 [Ktedonobacterales bacterium]
MTSAKPNAKSNAKPKGGAKTPAANTPSASATTGAPSGPVVPPRLRERYFKEIVPALEEEFHYGNVMRVPGLHKIVINIGMGEAVQTPKAMDNAVRDLSEITGQRPVVTRAKRSVAAFKLREGMPIGAMVTLRGQRMYDFLDRLVNVALPRLRDFQGVSTDAFDGRGNYTLGIREQLVFPEIDYDKIDKVRGMEITIVTTARTDEEGRRLLRLLGMPFRNK